MAVIESASVVDGSEVVEVGFGGGAGLARLLDQVGESGVVHGVEISETMLAGARQRFRREVANGRLHLHEASMERFSVATGSVDAVVSSNTIYFVDDLETALVELVRVLRPGGRLVLGVDDPEAMVTRPFARHGLRVRSLDEVTSLLHGADFAAVERHSLLGRTPAHVFVCHRTG